ncbi:tumor necrosis factor receptor superfamily member 10B isoform X2 [Haemorhous mexicanus]|uniref:tumor necrosis factor receptor superfamily member 10B isoform X2 n=1 Tax=Haemorhous mexicanus TaxID=30427 RepID=UPI0028BEBA77|nr:tumor necrosis factor receptor superfamily member 10B isoform X2 [Haemorhous mexicanus]
MRWPRRRWVPALLLVTVAYLGASAVHLRRRDSLDSLDVGWLGEDGYYMNSGGLYCKKCPAGTYISKECEEQRGSSTCVSCRAREYMEYPNAFHSCQECSVCREDQVELSLCHSQRNTVCVCRNGTFCPPEHPCEMCQKCQPRCPEGQVVLKPCTPYSDLQCGPDLDTSSTYLKIVIPVVIVMIAILIVIAVCYWKLFCIPPEDGRPSSRMAYEMSSMFQKLPWCKTEDVGTDDNVTNTQAEREWHGRAPERQEMLPSETERPWRSLVPAPGYDPCKALQWSFYTFGMKVLREDWKRFGRNLNLEENDITMGRSLDDFYEMMLRWQNREGSKASVTTLLDTLEDLRLRGVAENICDTLVQKGYFQKRAEGSGAHTAPPTAGKDSEQLDRSCL